MAKKKISLDEEDLKILESCVRRISGPKDREFIRDMLKALVTNNSIPISLLASMPVPPQKAGKTRFDQIYSASMSLVFPGYRNSTLVRLLGQGPIDEDLKIWRAVFPARYQLTHVLIRAHTYQQAFALACDYACRISLSQFHHIPVDLTIRVMFMSDGSLRRFLSMRELNRKKKRRELQLEARTYTDKHISGARLAALGPPKDPDHSIFKYIERKDLRRIRESGKGARVSSVESESFRPKARKCPPREL